MARLTLPFSADNLDGIQSGIPYLNNYESVNDCCKEIIDDIVTRAECGIGAQIHPPKKQCGGDE